MQLIRFESYIVQNCLKRTLKKFNLTAYTKYKASDEKIFS